MLALLVANEYLDTSSGLRKAMLKKAELKGIYLPEPWKGIYEGKTMRELEPAQQRQILDSEKFATREKRFIPSKKYLKQSRYERERLRKVG